MSIDLISLVPIVREGYTEVVDAAVILDELLIRVGHESCMIVHVALQGSNSIVKRVEFIDPFLTSSRARQAQPRVITFLSFMLISKLRFPCLMSLPLKSQALPTYLDTYLQRQTDRQTDYASDAT